MLNSLEYVYAERFVLSKLAGPEPIPRSLETKRPLHSFDLIIASIGFELDYIGLARLFDASDMPLYRAKRRKKPLLIIGGPVPSMNPLIPLVYADVVVVGEAEETIPLLVEAVYEEGARGLERLACRRGFLTADCNKAVGKAIVENLDNAFHSVIQFRVPGSGEPWGESYMVETSRGCGYMCRFCMESYFLMPLRHRSYARIVELVEKGVRANNVRKVAFYALSFFDHPYADKLLEKAINEGLGVTVGSLRADTLNEDRITLLARGGQQVLTIAPETLSTMLCKKIGKCIGYEVVEEAAITAWRNNMHVKLYLMVGLPGETDKDVEHTALVLRKLLSHAPPRRNALRATVNPLIPKPWTPLQRLPLIPREVYERRIRLLTRILSTRISSIEPLSYRYAYAETVIARGDETLADLIIEWARLGGRIGQLSQAARRLGVNLDKYAKGLVEPRWLEKIQVYPRKTLELLESQAAY